MMFVNQIVLNLAKPVSGVDGKCRPNRMVQSDPEAGQRWILYEQLPPHAVIGSRNDAAHVFVEGKDGGIVP